MFINDLFFQLQDGTYLQKLVQPTDNGTKRTVHDLLEDFSSPTEKAGEFNAFFFDSPILVLKY